MVMHFKEVILEEVWRTTWKGETWGLDRKLGYYSVNQVRNRGSLIHISSWVDGEMRGRGMIGIDDWSDIREKREVKADCQNLWFGQQVGDDILGDTENQRETFISWEVLNRFICLPLCLTCLLFQGFLLCLLHIPQVGSHYKASPIICLFSLSLIGICFHFYWFNLT